jgi:hypothetical protein
LRAKNPTATSVGITIVESHPRREAEVSKSRLTGKSKESRTNPARYINVVEHR